MADVEKVVIVGSGPAGWTAAIYAARAQLDPVVYVGVPKQNPGPVLPGGQLMLTTDVENYPGFPEGVAGPEMMSLFQKQAERFDTRVVGQDITRCYFNQRPFLLDTSSGEQIKAHSVIIATGATANWLGLENELRLAQIGGGVSACAVCDGALPLFRDQHLAVVGGGDTAMEEATYLTKFASKVSIIHRRDELRASKIMQDRFRSKENAEVLWSKQVVDVLGDEKIDRRRARGHQDRRALRARGQAASSWPSATRPPPASSKTPAWTSTSPATSSSRPAPARPISPASSPPAMSPTPSTARPSPPPAWAARPPSTSNTGSATRI